MRFPPACFLVALAFLALPIPSKAQTAALPNGSFETGGKLPDGWTTKGDVSLDENDKVDGKRSLLLKRDPVNLPATQAASEPFPITPGVWELSGAYEGDVQSPDLSFNVSISINSFDSAGKLLKERRMVAASGKTAWTHFKERLDIPAGAATASVEIEFNKTSGEFHADGFSLRYIGASIPMEGGDRKTVFKTNRIGNLFYPGDPVQFEMQVETPAQLEGAKLRAGWQVTDFYGAPMSSPQEAVLEQAGKTAKGWNLYRAVLDLRQLPLQVGPYYEAHTTIDLGTSPPAHDMVSFAILPSPVTLNLDPLSTPFGAHTWNATVAEYFPLAARLGLRRCLVFWNWPNTAPYTPPFDSGYNRLSRIDLPKRFGLAPYGVLYPVTHIEHHDGDQYSDEALREGIRQSIEKYEKDGLWGFQIGNEPPSANPEWVKKDVAAYKVIYEAIKKADPNIVAIGSAIGPNEEFFKAGFQPYQDVYNLHAYSDLGEMRHSMQQYKEMFKKYGGEKPIWSTETGSKSQGLPRDVIARDIIRKAACFFADGGGFFTWFAVGGMPDPDGERGGSYSDSMDLFASRYNMHMPRLDAVAFYHLINTLADKKFVSETKYPNGVHGFLFRDKFANSLFILWNEAAGQDVFIPLPGIHEVALKWMNGAARRLDADGKGFNLRLEEDPVFVSFRGDATPLPADLTAAPDVRVAETPTALIQGETVRVKVQAPVDKQLQLTGPATWKIESMVDDRKEQGSPSRYYSITVPDDTAARVASFRLSDETVTAQGNTELRFGIPVRSKMEVNLVPLAGAREGDSSVRVSLANHSDKPQPVSWKVEILDELPMAHGTYKLEDAKPSSAFFDGVAADKLTLSPRETKEIVLPMKGTDRLTLYKLRASVIDSDGNVAQRERRVGGFARAVHSTGNITLDGKFDEPAWRDAPTYAINEQRQFCAVVKTAKPWGGLQDLSGTLRFAWDDKCLYVGVEVVDDIFSGTKSDDLMWDQDGLQFLIDPYRSQSQSLGRYDISLGLGTKGLQAWCHMSADVSAPAGLAPDIKFAVEPTSKENGNRNYEVAIPWSRLAPFKPKAGGDLGFTMVINDDDGAGRQSTMGWFGGVHLKEANFVGDVILDK